MRGPSTPMAAASVQPVGAAFDVVLLLHVVAAVVGVLTLVVSAVQAARILTTDAGSEPAPSLRRFYAPGATWAGRVLYAVPVLGAVLVVLSDGYYGLGDAWILAGLVLWATAAVVAEAGLWPAERRLRQVVGEGSTRRAGTARAATVGARPALAEAVGGVSGGVLPGAAAEVPATEVPVTEPAAAEPTAAEPTAAPVTRAVRSVAGRAALSASLAVVLVVAAMVVMVAQP